MLNIFHHDDLCVCEKCTNKRSREYRKAAERVARDYRKAVKKEIKAHEKYLKRHGLPNSSK